MNSLYNHGIKQTQLLTKDLATFEKNLSTSPLSLQGSITTTLNAFNKTIRDYEDLVNQNKHDESNSKHETRLNKFQEDLGNFNKKFNDLKLQRENIIQESNKQELMGRRNVHHSTSGNPYNEEQQYEQQQQQQQLSAQESLYNERQSLSRGTQQLDHILEMGQQTFEDIVEQNETLRKLATKFEEGLVTLGVSQGTIRTIERRAKQDKWLFWGGVIGMCLIFWLILKWFR